MSLKRLAHHYINTAVLVFNTLLFLVLLNAGLFVVLFVKDHYFNTSRDNLVVKRYFDQTWNEVYEGNEQEDISKLLYETWSRRQEYQQFTQHAERPFEGEFVNVSKHGYRPHSQQGPWPPDNQRYNVFLFGGSTTFGYGVADDETLAPFLQESLTASTGRRVSVYNFGNASYRSTQERVRLEELLLAGNVPDMAIFVDGLNEFAFPSGLSETRRLARIYETGGDHPVMGAIDKLPMMRMGRAIKRRIRGVRRSESVASPVQPGVEEAGGETSLSDIVEPVVARYLANKKLTEIVAGGYGVKTVFVWQPVPMYKYDLSNHLFAKGGFPHNSYASPGYGYFEGYVDRHRLGDNFLWCADVHEGVEGVLYVDKIHYSKTMNQLLAGAIVDKLMTRDLTAGIH